MANRNSLLRAQLIAGALDRGLNGVFGFLDRSEQRQQARQQREEELAFRQQQADQVQQARGRTDLSALLQLTRTDPAAAELLSQDPYYKKLLGKAGERPYLGEAFEAPGGGVIRAQDSGIAPPELPVAPVSGLINLPSFPGRDPSGVGRVGIPEGAVPFAPGVGVEVLKPLRSLDGVGVDIVTGGGAPPPAPGTPGYLQSQGLPSLVRKPKADVGQSQLDKLIALGRRRQAAQPLGVLGAEGRKLATERRFAGTPATQQNLDTLEQQLLLQFPDAEEIIKERVRGLREALPVSSSDAEIAAQQKAKTAGLGSKRRSILDQIGVYGRLLSSKTSEARDLTTLNLTPQAKKARDAIKGYTGRINTLRKQLLALDNKTGATTGSVGAPTVDPGATRPVQGRKARSGAARDVGGEKAREEPRTPDYGTGALGGVADFVGVDIEPLTLAMSASPAHTQKRNAAVKEFVSGNLDPGSSAWRSKASILYPDPDDPKLVRFNERSNRLNAAMASLAATPSAENIKAVQLANSMLGPLEVSKTGLRKMMERSPLQYPDTPLGNLISTRDSVAARKESEADIKGLRIQLARALSHRDASGRQFVLDRVNSADTSNQITVGDLRRGVRLSPKQVEYMIEKLGIGLSYEDFPRAWVLPMLNADVANALRGL